MIVGGVQNEQSSDAPQRESFVRHPMQTAEEEAAHVRQVAAKGENPATPFILVAAVIAFLVPIVATVMILAFGIPHLV